LSDGYRPKGPLSVVATPPEGGTGVVRPQASADLELQVLRRELAEAVRLMPTDTDERQRWLVRVYTAVNGRLQ
jgi:hypothetical protein